MKLQIGVIGQSGPISEAVAQAAEAVGRHIAKAGAVLLTGGRDGVMAAASRGARQAGGLTVGILPGCDPEQGNPYLDVAVTTGLDFEWRSLVLVHACDALIAIAGGNGTLGEISAAYHNGVPVVVLRRTGGWADRLRTAALERGRYLDARRLSSLHYARTPATAVRTALRLARAYRASRSGAAASSPAGDVAAGRGR